MAKYSAANIGMKTCKDTLETGKVKSFMDRISGEKKLGGEGKVGKDK